MTCGPEPGSKTSNSTAVPEMMISGFLVSLGHVCNVGYARSCMAQQLDDRLRDLMRSSRQFMEILDAARDVDPPDWVVGSGIIRDLVWDSLHGWNGPLRFKDVDVAFFDPHDLSPEGDAQVADRLRARLPRVAWDAKNQAGVHLWFEERFGYPVDPLTSIEDAVGTWPETAVCVAVRLLRDDSIKIVAPLGLEDLFAPRLRRNPRRVSVEEFRRRLACKKVPERWPLVCIEADG
jgi:uncharacterized protein